MEDTAAVPAFDDELNKCKLFLSEFSRDDDTEVYYPYINILQDVANRTTRVVSIELEDVLEHSVDDDFVDRISSNTERYVNLFSKAIDELLPAPTVDVEDEDVYDVLRSTRMQQQASSDGGPLPDPNVMFPAEITRRYEIQIVPRTKTKPVAIRKIRASAIGSLVRVEGIVTRITDVKPLLRVATYTCDTCGHEIYQEAKGPEIAPLTECPSQDCSQNQVKGELHQLVHGCKFIKFQELKLQEMADQVPVGHVPRTLTVQVTGELTRSCNAGDMVTVSGIFLPVPKTGYRAMVSGLVSEVYLSAMQVHRKKEHYGEYVLTEETEDQIRELQAEGSSYERLASSIAPEIFGHEDVKRALLLLMVGGVTRSLPDGMRIRGDINICLMGDPGVAKSQLLKHISSIAPRAVYTTGKGSSGVGLTAAVIKDKTTGEFVLEGGALVLADMGICCIDEFDKMEDSDRTAIHEVMEQQTVSIAKAGITTTLNARTSILAAANPLHGRYNPSKTAAQNINLPAALLSRFDLLFLLLDIPNVDNDKRLARHITHVHRHMAPPERAETEDHLKPSFMRAYIAEARKFNPSIPEDVVADHLVNQYVTIRAEQRDTEVRQRRGDKSVGKLDDTYVTARSLLGIMRLAQGLARLRFSNEVSPEDVEESIRLMKASKSSIADRSVRQTERVDPMDAIFPLVMDIIKEKGSARKASYQEIRDRVVAKGYSVEQLDTTLNEYEEMDLLSVNQRRTLVRIA